LEKGIDLVLVLDEHKVSTLEELDYARVRRVLDLMESQ
jgi:hypothetical protein